MLRAAGTLVMMLVLVVGGACKAEPRAGGEEAKRAGPEVVAAGGREDESPEPIPAPPEFVLLGWDSKLYLSPEASASSLALTRAEDTPAAELGRVVAVVGKADAAGRWWTLDPSAPVPSGAGGRAIEGLGHYEVQLHVPAGTGTPVELPAAVEPDRNLEPKPEIETQAVPAPDSKRERKGGEAMAIATIGVTARGVPSQSGEPRPEGLEHEWQVDEGAPLYWSSGARAGTVRATHAFFVAGEARQIAGQDRLCFDARIGPPKRASTQLCFDPEAVHQRPVAGLDEVIGDLGSVIGDSKGLGLGTRGVGLKNEGPNYGGIGDLGGREGLEYGAGDNAAD